MKRKTFLLTLLVLAVAAFLFLRRPPPVPPPAVLRPTTRQDAQARRHIETLQQELQPGAAPQEGAPAGPQDAPTPAPPEPRTLRLSEEDLNVTLADNKAARKMLAARGVKAVQIILSEPANLTILAAVQVKGQPANVQIVGTLAPDPRLGLRFTATHAQAGRFPLPPAAVTAQADTLATQLAAQMHGRLPFAVRSVQVQGKTLVLTGLLIRRGRVRPPAPASPR